MAYPLIILGAGASLDFLKREDYPDYSPDLDQYIPPLTNNIFDGTKFHEILEKYPEMSRLVDYIRVKLRGDTPKTLEQILTTLYQEKVKLDRDLYVSFMSLMFYLADLFQTVTEKYYRSHNNYGALLKMLGFYGNKALFVNFNYDLLLEKSLGKDGITSVDELINGNFPIIKIHGAYNWYWRRLVNAWGDEKKNSYDLSLSFAEGIFNASNNTKGWELVLRKSYSPKRLESVSVNFISAYSYHPALALPVLSKRNFMCPESHIQFLVRGLSQIDRVVIIGWKIGDPFLKKLLVEELEKRDISIAFVGGSEAKVLAGELDGKIKSNIKLINDRGFSNFLSSDEGEEFFI